MEGLLRLVKIANRECKLFYEFQYAGETGLVTIWESDPLADSPSESIHAIWEGSVDGDFTEAMEIMARIIEEGICTEQ